MFHYFIIHKPYLVLSQFSAQAGKQTLADFFNVPKDVYPVGRLDYDSEGLLLLTNDKTLNHRLLHPQFKHERTYWVQVDGAITTTAIAQLTKGVIISIDGKQHVTQPCTASVLITPPTIAERNPPIRYRKNIPTSWIALTLHEGKNRQVRRMCAAVGFPVLRLIRYSIEQLTIDGLQPGAMQILTKTTVNKALFKTV
jgi:23S rRNA pseudouridine2457 synthase